MKNSLSRFTLLLLVCLSLATIARADTRDKQSQPIITITGTVNCPMQLTLNDLQQLQSTTVKFNEVSSDGAFHGVFSYHAVPLQTLLNLADIEQKGSTFKKLVDATIVLSDAKGKKVVLSWGEIYYHNPAEVTLAYRANPVLPVKHNCATCHEAEDYQFAMDQLRRNVALPKLLINGDFYSDRFLEGVVNIDVVDVRPAIPVNRDAKLFSRQIQFGGAVTKPLCITSLDDYPRTQFTKKIVGVGRGYHGLHHFNGTPLATLLSAAGVKPRMDQVVIIWAPDGYRSTFSMGELFVSATGQQIILTDTKDGKAFAQGGNIRILVGPDNTDDRDVQAITNIEVIDLK